MTHTKIDHDDLLSKTGAGLLAEAINTYWRERGYSVHAERVDCDGHWAVRSQLVNGLPRGARQEQARTMLQGLVSSIRKVPVMTDEDAARAKAAL